MPEVLSSFFLTLSIVAGYLFVQIVIARVDRCRKSRRVSNEAIALAAGEGPDLIFMDMELPDIDGVETTAILRQNPKTAHIPVVALTAWISELLQEKASQVGIATYLIKPVAPQTLKQTIEEYTKRSLSDASL
jgi:two-component system, cell cycle response regulator DivK